MEENCELNFLSNGKKIIFIYIFVFVVVMILNEKVCFSDNSIVFDFNTSHTLCLQNDRNCSNINSLKLEKTMVIDGMELSSQGKYILSEDILKNDHYFIYLVNKKTTLPKEYKPSDLRKVNIPFTNSKTMEMCMRDEAASALEKLYKDALKDGIYLKGVSGYRSYSLQNKIFSYNVSTKGFKESTKYSAKAGESEHQTGLAVDLSCRSINYLLEDTFAETEEGKWLQDNCYKYGFILRYPKGKEHVTGYEYEPWHIRYVGKELAQYLIENNLTLDEFYS